MTFEKIKDQLAAYPVNDKTKRFIKAVKDLGFKYLYGWASGDKTDKYHSIFHFEKEYHLSYINVEIYYFTDKNKVCLKVFSDLRNPTFKNYTKIHNDLMELYELK